MNLAVNISKDAERRSLFNFNIPAQTGPAQAPVFNDHLDLIM